jgi:hypothetical protein
MAQPIPFVTPCCFKINKELTSLEQVAVVQLRSGFWGWNTRCCQDNIDPNTVTPAMILKEQRAVLDASVKAARAALEHRHKLEVLGLDDTIAEFTTEHDPELEREYVSAIWGESEGYNVANYHTRSSATRRAALEEVIRNGNHLLQEGYVEISVNDNWHKVDGLRKFVKGNEIRYTGYWPQPIIGHRDPGHCEAAYLRTD